MSSESPNNIEHVGRIRSVDGNTVTVDLEHATACGSCHAKTLCGIAEGELKTVTVHSGGRTYSPGETVVVVLMESVGLKALFLGYVLPFIILVVTLIIASRYSGKEYINGLIALGALIPYYGMLYLFRDRLQKTFTCRIK